jgi:hypothetical protein
MHPARAKGAATAAAGKISQAGIELREQRLLLLLLAWLLFPLPLQLLRPICRQGRLAGPGIAAAADSPCRHCCCRDLHSCTAWLSCYNPRTNSRPLLLLLPLLPELHLLRHNRCCLGW